jgi:hypothetical protein
MLKNPKGMQEIFRRQNLAAISRHISSASLLDVSASNCQRALVDKSGMIKHQIVTHNRSEIVAVYWSPCAPTRIVTVPVQCNAHDGLSHVQFAVEPAGSKHKKKVISLLPLCNLNKMSDFNKNEGKYCK